MKISYNQLTVKEYQDLQKYFKSEMSVDDWIKVLSYLSNKPVSHWESIPIKTLKKYLTLISYLSETPKPKFKKFILKGLTLYKADREAKNLSTAQYASIKEFCKDGQQVANLDKICSMVYKRLTWRGWVNDVKYFEKDCENFKRVSIGKVYGAVFFCSKVLIFLMENSKDYLEAMDVIKKRMEELETTMREETFWSSGVGMQL